MQQSSTPDSPKRGERGRAAEELVDVALLVFDSGQARQATELHAAVFGRASFSLPQSVASKQCRQGMVFEEVPRLALGEIENLLAGLAGRAERGTDRRARVEDGHRTCPLASH
jgi:hypothetical protein